MNKIVNGARFDLWVAERTAQRITQIERIGGSVSETKASRYWIKEPLVFWLPERRVPAFKADRV